MLHTLSGPWRIERAIIITNTPHISRARLLFQRCFDGNLYFLTDGSKLGATDWMYQYAYQSAAFVKAALTTEC